MRTLLLSLLSALCCAALVVGCKKDQSAETSTQNYDQSREGVIAAVQSGKLKPDASGVVTLPPEWKDQSMTGQVYVGNDPAAGLLVLFPLMKGSGAIECMLYADKPLPSGPGTTQVGQMTVRRTGQATGKWYRATLPSGPGR